MHTHFLLYQLRERLRLVNERTVERKEEVRANCNSGALGTGLLCALASGALIELRSEALFLAGLIADIEGEGGVTPEDDPRYSVIADLVERHDNEGRS